MMKLFVKIVLSGDLGSQCRSDHRRQPGHSEKIVSRGRRFTLFKYIPDAVELPFGKAEVWMEEVESEKALSWAKEKSAADLSCP